MRPGTVEKGDTAVSDDELRVQFSTRVPKTLHRELRLHCIQTEISLMDFVVQALNEKLKRAASRRQR